MDIELLDQYLTSVRARFECMSRAGLDTDGLVRFDRMLDRATESGLITPGEFEYLMDRTHSRGRYPDYNTHRGLDLKYGSMRPFPLEAMIEFTDWRLPVSSTLNRRLLDLGYNIKINRARLQAADRGWVHPAFETL